MSNHNHENNQDNNNNENVLNETETSSPSQEEKEREFQEFLKQQLKQVTVTNLSATTQEKVQVGVGLLEALRHEILEKRQGVLEKSDFIKEKVGKLKASDKVNIDEKEFVQSEHSAIEYVRLLDKMNAEILQDVSFYKSLFSEEPPKAITVFKHETDDFEQYILDRIASIRKYVKNARRDLAVSYSRYSFGFDVQIRQILYVERVLEKLKKDNG